MPDIPTSTTFPAKLNLTITPPPPTHPPTNILILLHGLGDTHASFDTLARQLSLPETACLTLQAATPLPFDLGGFHWGDDIIFDQASGTMDFDTGFTKSTRLIKEEIIKEGLMGKCGYKLREIMLFGYGQGGMAALAVAASLAAEQELGGVISIGGTLPSSVSTVSPRKVKTPVLVLGGSSHSLVTSSAVARLKDVFETVEYMAWNKSGDGMPANREEMLPIMQFFARRLRSRHGVPEGSMEVG